MSNSVCRAASPLSWMRSRAQPLYTYRCCALIDVTEPRAKLEHETLEPLVLELREREYGNIVIEILAVGEAAQVVVAFVDAGHGKLVTTDPARDPDAAKGPIIPVENDTPAGTARVGSKVTGQQIVFHLRADSAGTLARQAQAGGDVAADVHRRQEGVQVLEVKMDNPALHDGTGAGVGRVLGIAGPKTVHIPAHLDFIQTVVDAVKNVGRQRRSMTSPLVRPTASCPLSNNMRR